MKLLQKLIGLLWPKYKRRQQMIAWLTLEGWEPKVKYLSSTCQVKILVREKQVVRTDSNEIHAAVFDCPTPCIAWAAYSLAELGHLSVMAEWANARRK